jgi:hypothetical protein
MEFKVIKVDQDANANMTVLAKAETGESLTLTTKNDKVPLTYVLTDGAARPVVAASKPAVAPPQVPAAAAHPQAIQAGEKK